MQITIVVTPKSDKQRLDWSLEFIDPRHLEDTYVSTLMSDISDTDTRFMQAPLREEYLRNRFRSYMNNLQLFKPDDTPFEPLVQFKENHVFFSNHPD